MAVYCVNRSSDEFKQLQEQTDMHPAVLAAKVSVWQVENGLDKFPQLEDLKTLDPKKVSKLFDEAATEDLFTLEDTTQFYEDEDVEEGTYYDTATLEKKVEFTLNQIKDTVENNIKIYESLYKRSGKKFRRLFSILRISLLTFFN